MLEKVLLFGLDLGLEIFVFVVLSFLLAEALPTYLALVDGLRLHAARASIIVFF
jgi:hypothetical protein